MSDNKMLKKDVSFQVKELSEDGTFTGALSVYGVIDEGGDVVERGAFTKTIAESGGKVPMLYQHDPRLHIGVLELSDTSSALNVKGIFNMDIPQAKQAHSMLGFMKTHGMKMGLSIGYRVVKDAISGGIRQLKELRLLEGSIVVSPMNTLCYVTDVKSDTAIETKEFADSLASIQAWSMREQLMSALSDSFFDVFYGGDLTVEERTAAAAKTIDDFKSAFMESLPSMLNVRGIKQIPVPITEQGRKFLTDIQSKISLALSPIVDPTTNVAGVDGKKAVEKTIVAEGVNPLHSWVKQFGEDPMSSLNR